MHVFSLGSGCILMWSISFSDAKRPSFAAQVNVAVPGPHHPLTTSQNEEDPDDWLNVDSQDFEAMLEQTMGSKSNGMDVDEPESEEAAEERIASDQALKLKELAAKVEDFVEGEGEIDGAIFDEYVPGSSVSHTAYRLYLITVRSSLTNPLVTKTLNRTLMTTMLLMTWLHDKLLWISLCLVWSLQIMAKCPRLSTVIHNESRLRASKPISSRKRIKPTLQTRVRPPKLNLEQSRFGNLSSLGTSTTALTQTTNQTWTKSPRAMNRMKNDPRLLEILKSIWGKKKRNSSSFLGKPSALLTTNGMKLSRIVRSVAVSAHPRTSLDSDIAHSFRSFECICSIR